MKRVTLLPLFACVCAVFAGSVFESVSADWLTLPSRFTHDVLTGERVAQFAPVEPPSTAVMPPLRTSGYTHYRSSLAYGQSADNYHQVEQWGDPVRPYGEWRFPYRPYSTPYPNWGAPYAGLSFNNIYPGFGQGYGGGIAPVGPGGGGNPGNPGNGGGAGNPYGPQRPGQQWRRPNPAAGTDGFAPYPSGRGTPYPVAPYYDGYHPNYRD
ncbi:hypothetical protein FHS27_004201 [Rhodopirellula rubra]|uniref:Uncharacterized protein n=1 Tax=Aporhodopirellula rubra TaxID=980271 RepID=A0A7W5H7H5_9BACT|nr:hypothetical protein [Aporhodopirellula rubra]MBB3208373.1 hypothetical protein [Aporhodopirellula rubra]